MPKLNALAVQRANKPGLYGDGEGLYLRVAPTGGKSWVFRYTKKICGCESSCGCEKKDKYRTRDMGLGPFPLVSLAAAREARDEERRKLLKDAHDPIDARKAARRKQAEDDAKNLTFEQCAAEYLEGKRTSWSERFLKQRSATLARFVYPVFGKIPARDVDSKLVLDVLKPIWAEKTTTAIQLRATLESILDWIKHRGYRTGENPARWRGQLEYELPNPSKVRSVKHFAALPFEEIPEFMPLLRAQLGVAPRAVEFTILTAARSGETRGARWEEINFDARTWVIPPQRMKAGKEHQVPLSPRTVEILEQRKEEVSKVLGENPTGLIFSNRVGGPALSDMSLTAVLRRMNSEITVHGEKRKLTVHGFRSTFRDWVGDRTAFPREVAEAALAHTLGKVEGAYRRGTAFEKRVKLMNAWAEYCSRSGESANVVGINSSNQPSSAGVVSL